MTLRSSARTAQCHLDLPSSHPRFKNRTLRQAWTQATMLLQHQATGQIHTTLPRQVTWQIRISTNLQRIRRIHSRNSRETLWNTISGEMTTRQATTRRITIPDGIQDCKYATKEREKAKANLSRKERGILMIPTGQFQNYEKQLAIQESCYSWWLICQNSMFRSNP